MNDTKPTLKPDFSLQKELIKWLIGLISAVLLTGTAFYFNTLNTIATHAKEIEKMNQRIEQKADQAIIEKRLDRIENKLDNIIQFNLNKSQK